MPTRELLAPSQRAQFTDFNAPLDDRTLARFYTLSDTDLELIRRHRRASTQLGFAVQLGYARLPGRVLRVGEEAHPQIVATLASQLGVDPAAFAAYLHGRDTTRREHQLELQRDFGFRSFSATTYRELAGWLLPIALSTDVGPVLVGALIDELRERKILAPALSTIERLAWETRRRAERLVFVRLTAIPDQRAARATGRPAGCGARCADDHPGSVAPATPPAHTSYLRGAGPAAADDSRPLVWSVQRLAQRRVQHWLLHPLSVDHRKRLDELVEVDPELTTRTRLSWLREAPEIPSAKSLRKVLDRLAFLYAGGFSATLPAPTTTCAVYP